MFSKREAEKLPLPKDWEKNIRSTVLHIIALAFKSLTYARGWAVNSPIHRVRLAAELDQCRCDGTLKDEAIHLLTTRFSRLPSHQRPHYTPQERMAILELKATHNLSLEQTASLFLVGSSTVSAWMKRIDEQGERALVQLREPVNKFPEFVKYLVQRLSRLCPKVGTVKIAETIARAGLHISKSTIDRFCKEPDVPENNQKAKARVEVTETPKKGINAKYPNHTWGVDLTAVPISGGNWVPWFPFCLPRHWPFCWWLMVVVDHYSRRVMGFALFKQELTSLQVRHALGQLMARAKIKPRYLICDQGSQFIAKGFKTWCNHKSRNIQLRYGAVGKHGSIAVVERLIRSIKDECLRRCLFPCVWIGCERASPSTSTGTMNIVRTVHSTEPRRWRYTKAAPRPI